MRRLISLVILLGSIIIWAPGATAAGKPVFLVYVSQITEIAPGRGGSQYAEIATLVKEMQAEGKEVILFHGGNFLGPSALSSYDKGAHMIGVLNALMPDIVALGRRDFMHKEDELVLRTGEAVFPIVCSNVYDPISLEAPGSTQRVQVLKTTPSIGFMALVSPEMQVTYIQQRLVMTGGQELFPKLAAELHGKGARFTVASADFMPDPVEEVFAESGPDLLFVSGTAKSGLSMYGDKALATHAANGRDAVIVRLEPDGRGSYKISGAEVKTLADFTPDPQMTRLIERYSGLFSNLSKVSVGKTFTEIDTRTRLLRSGENAMGNLVCDALRDYYGADIAIMNSGGIRGNHVYEAGSILSRGDLQSEMPLHDVSCFVEVRGEVLLAALEHGVGQIEEFKGKFLQVSGMSYTFDPEAPVGSRIISVTIGNKPLKKDKIYSVALPEYFVKHGDGFYMFPSECSRKASRPAQELVEIVRVYLSLNSPVSPRIEGRIKRVEQGS